jgi:hypothetical protein
MSKEKALKRINEYLAKQEPQKVELGLVDDLEKKESLIKEASGIRDQFLTDFNSAKRQLRALESVSKEIKIYLKLVDKIKQSFKELGIDVPKKVFTIESNFNQAVKDAERYKKFKL